MRRIAHKVPLHHKQPTTHQAEESDVNSSLQSIEDLKGMGFDSPNYSPIPPVGNTAPQ